MPESNLRKDEVKRLQRIIDGKTIKQIANYHDDTVDAVVNYIRVIDQKIEESREKDDKTEEERITCMLADACEWDSLYERMEDDFARISDGDEI